ncbi:hypothetical protein ACFL35_18400 [Candidatus Riflebacteria bacterium]
MVRFILYFCLFILFASGAPGADAKEKARDFQQRDQAREYFQRGQAYQQQYRFMDALWEYNSGKRLYGYYARKCLYFAGYCNVKLYRYWDAERDYKDYILYYPYGELIDAAHYVLGRVYEEQFKYDQARQMYRTVINRWPHSQYAWKARERLDYIGNRFAEEYQKVSDTKKSALENEPFSDGLKASKKDLILSLDRDKTDKRMYQKIRYTLTFDKLHGDKNAEKYLKIIEGR